MFPDKARSLDSTSTPTRKSVGLATRRHSSNPVCSEPLVQSRIPRSGAFLRLVPPYWEAIPRRPTGHPSRRSTSQYSKPSSFRSASHFSSGRSSSTYSIIRTSMLLASEAMESSRFRTLLTSPVPTSAKSDQLAQIRDKSSLLSNCITELRLRRPGDQRQCVISRRSSSAPRS